MGAVIRYTIWIWGQKQLSCYALQHHFHKHFYIFLLFRSLYCPTLVKPETASVLTTLFMERFMQEIYWLFIIHLSVILKNFWPMLTYCSTFQTGNSSFPRLQSNKRGKSSTFVHHQGTLSLFTKWRAHQKKSILQFSSKIKVSLFVGVLFVCGFGFSVFFVYFLALCSHSFLKGLT